MDTIIVLLSIHSQTTFRNYSNTIVSLYIGSFDLSEFIAHFFILLLIKAV